MIMYVAMLQSNLSPTGIPLPTPSLHNSITVEEAEDGSSDQEPDPDAVQRSVCLSVRLSVCLTVCDCVYMSGSSD